MTDERRTGRPEDVEGAKPRIHVRDKRTHARDGGSSADVSSAAGDSPVPQPPATAANDELQKLADDRLDQLMRLKADFENFRKRELREKTEIVERASLRIVERLLPVLDDFDRAIDAIRSHTDDDAFVRGLEIVLAQLRGLLEEEGLERVSADGAFDPHEHEAVSSVPGDVAEPTVLEVVRPGYKLKGKTIRPALVQVAVPQPAAEGGHPGGKE